MPVVLGDRYRLDTLIGGGGMGEVWRSHDELLDRDVAVKVIRENLADDESVRTRLRTEAHLAGSLHHQNIVDVYDYGEHEDESGQTTPYLVMPLIDGVSLAAMLKSRVALPVGETMSIVTEMAQALAAAHEAGIVHRDLKPGNVMITPSGRVMILDFGIARSLDAEPLTQTGALLGTADYLSPEQAAGKQATYASDLYALGIVAFTCLTGTPPFHRETDIATALAHIQAPPPELPAEIQSSGIGPMIGSLLAKDPAQRPSASEVAAIAGALATTVPTDLGRATAPDATQPGAAATTAGGAETAGAATTTTLAGATIAEATPGRRGSRRTVLISSAVLALAAVVLAFMYVSRGDIEVPDVRKMTSVEAASTLAAKGLKVKTHDVDAAGYKAGVVVTQSPDPGSRVDEGTVVDLGVATGLVAIPQDLLGTSYDDAAKILEALGLQPERDEQTSSKPAGTVIAVDPSTHARPGATVILTVARPGGGDDSDDKKEDKGKGKQNEDTTPTPVDPDPSDPPPSEPTPTATSSATTSGG
ncbi:Stk1 family PASTA domain-containing Ser/Thr kinase [Aeromicrobium panaciterrae]|uniref:protein kinase domain-containing protein n=1 Tax=Aeromicrobium panaciterrae TaxID=363861 RepID=UPI0031CFF8E5